MGTPMICVTCKGAITPGPDWRTTPDEGYVHLGECLRTYIHVKNRRLSSHNTWIGTHPSA